MFFCDCSVAILKLIGSELEFNPTLQPVGKFQNGYVLVGIGLLPTAYYLPTFNLVPNRKNKKSHLAVVLSG
jgi:hypothetical protein